MSVVRILTFGADAVLSELLAFSCLSEFRQYIQSRSTRFDTVILFVSHLLCTPIYPYFFPFFLPSGANHNGTSLPFRMWAGIQAAVSRADSKVVLQISHQDAFVGYDWQLLSSRTSTLSLQQVQLPSLGIQPSSFPSSGQPIGNLRDFSMP